MRSIARASAGNTIIICDLTEVEFFSTTHRMQRGNRLRQTSAARLRTLFLSHAQTEYITISVTGSTFGLARNLSVQYPLRTLDAIQLASSIQARQQLNVAITFISADKDLLAAAAAEGFAVDNPLLHP